MDNLFPREGKKGELLQASLALFASRGYDAVSVRDIAKAAGVSEAALYKHFAGKHAMALHIFTAIITDYTARLKVVGASGDGAVAKLCSIVGLTYELYRLYPAEIRFALLSQYFFWDEVPEENKPHFILRRIIEDGMASGEIARREGNLWLTAYSGLMLQPLAAYPYFHDVLPAFDELGLEIEALVKKLFS